MTSEKDLSERIARLEAMDGEKIYHLTERVAKLESKISLLITLLLADTTILTSLLIHFALGV